jgi:nucleoside-diphosphate-sugar epimerase
MRGQDAVVLSVAGGMVDKDGQVMLDADAYTDTYLGTARAVVAALAHAPSVQHIIFFSSTSAYGDAGEQAVVNEATPATPKSIFQQVYVDAEQTLLQAAGPRICVLRTGNIYGPGRELRTQAAAMAGRTVPLDGEAGAMVVHRDDVVRAAEFALKQNLSGLYNLVNDVTQSKREFFGAVCERAGFPPIEWKPFGAGIQQASNAKLKAAGFAFADPFAQKDGEALL